VLQGEGAVSGVFCPIDSLVSLVYFVTEMCSSRA